MKRKPVENYAQYNIIKIRAHINENIDVMFKHCPTSEG